jgi:hypothetical protein
MTNESDNFERQIERIHLLLESEDSIVTWNDRVPDPDNPSQKRQIDVSIRRDDALTLVECRIHSQPQDVTWIEELIGRRSSLEADAVIAVSASGFTRGAVLKGNAHGILLRDMKSLSVDEIRSWGKRTAVSVDLHHFANVSMCFIFQRSAEGLVSADDVEEAIRRREIGLLPLFDKVVDSLRQYGHLEPVAFAGRLVTSALSVKGYNVVGIDLRAECWHENKELSIAAVVAYDTPESGALEFNTYVEIVEQGRFEITQSSNVVSVALDISAINRPKGAKVGMMHFHFNRPVEMREVIRLGDVDPGFWVEPLRAYNL